MAALLKLAQWCQARRGELFNHAPIGYVRVPGGLALDPDEQAQAVVRLLFDQFGRQGSLHGLLRYLVRHGIRLPVRPPSGPNRGRPGWHRPNREALQNLPHHPVCAGYYRHGCRALDPRRQVPGRPGAGRTTHRPEDCPVLLEGRRPAHITPERFWTNRARLEANRARAGGRRPSWAIPIGGIARLRPPPAAVTRRRYVVRHYELSPPAYQLLRALLAGQTVGEAIGQAARAAGPDLDRFAAKLRAWFRDWAAEGFFRALEQGH